MPTETKNAVNWALQQQYELKSGVFVVVSVESPFTLVDKVREYFNQNAIAYDGFSFNDLIPFIN